MNSLHIIGNLTADAEIHTAVTQSGSHTACNFTVAVNRKAGGQKYTEFFRVVIWDKWAEAMRQYLKKGVKVAVTGTVSCRAYKDKNGEARASLEVNNTQYIELLTRVVTDGADSRNEFVEQEDPDLPL